MIIYRLNKSEMKKYIELSTLDVKIGPFSRILGLETSSLRLRFTGLRLFGYESNFESLPVLLHDHIPSQSISNEKIHWVRYPGCQNRTIFKDFRFKIRFKAEKLQLCKFSSTNLRCQGIKSLKMVRFWHPGYLIQCIFSFLIDWDGIWSCRSTGSGHSYLSTSI